MVSAELSLSGRATPESDKMSENEMKLRKTKRLQPPNIYLSGSKIIARLES